MADATTARAQKLADDTLAIQQKGTARQQFVPPPTPISLADRLFRLQRRGYYNIGAGFTLTSAFTAPLVAGGGAINRAAADYDQAFAKVAALTDVSREKINDLKAATLALAKDPLIRQMPQDLGQGMYYVASVVKDADDALKALKTSALGASAGLGDTQQVANIVTGAMDAFHISAGKSVTITDKLVAAVREGKSEGPEFAAALAKVSGTASTLGVSLDEVLASMATMTRLSISASQAGVSLNQILIKLVNPSKQVRDEFKAIGTSVEEVRRNMRANGLFQELQRLFGLAQAKGGQNAVITLFGSNVRELRGVLATTGTQLETYRRILDSVTNAQGETARAAQAQGNTFNAQLDKLKQSVQAAAIELGEHFLPVTTNAVQVIGQALPGAVDNAIAAWDRLDPLLKNAVIGLVALAALTGPLKILGGTLQILAAAVAAFAEVPALIPVFVALGFAGAIAYQNIVAGANYAAVAQGNAAAAAKTMGEGFARALLFAGDSKKAAESIAKIQAAAQGAEKDGKKLVDTIRALAEEKLEIGKDLKLDPLGKAALVWEVDRLIRELSSRAIELNVSVGEVQTAQRGGFTPESRRRSWAERGRAVGVVGPAIPIPQPPQTERRPVKGGVYVDVPPSPEQWDAYSAALSRANKAQADFQRQVASAEQAQQSHTMALRRSNETLTEQQRRIAENESARRAANRALSDGTDYYRRAGGVQDEQAHKLRAIRLELNAIAAEWAGLAKRNPLQGDDVVRAQELLERRHALESKRDEIVKAQQDAAKQKALDDKNARAAVGAEDAERQRRQRIRTLAEEQQMWQQAGGVLERATQGLVQFGKKTDEAAVRAALLRGKFQGLPGDVQQAIIRVAQLSDRAHVLAQFREQVGGFFGDAYKQMVAQGRSTDPVTRSVTMLEQRLHLERRINATVAEGAALADRTARRIDARNLALRAQQEQLQEAGKKAAQVYGGRVPGIGGGREARGLGLEAMLPPELQAMLNVRLPREWGAPVKHGEFTGFREELQALLMDTKKVDEWKKKLGPAFDDVMKWLRRRAESFDFWGAVFDQNEGLRRSRFFKGDDDNLSKQLSWAIQESGLKDVGKSLGLNLGNLLTAPAVQRWQQDAKNAGDIYARQQRLQRGQARELRSLVEPNATNYPVPTGSFSALYYNPRMKERLDAEMKFVGDLMESNKDIKALLSQGFGTAGYNDAQREIERQKDQFLQTWDAMASFQAWWDQAQFTSGQGAAGVVQQNRVRDIGAGLSAQDVGQNTEDTRLYFERFDHYAAQVDAATASLMAMDDVQTAALVRAKTLTGDAAEAGRNYNRELGQTLALLGAQGKLASAMPSDAPELEIQTRLLERRNEIERQYAQYRDAQGNFSDKDRERNYQAELAGAEKLVRAEDALNRLRESRANVTGSLDSALRAELDNQLALLYTAKERAAVEWDFYKAQQQRRGIAIDPQEAANHEREVRDRVMGEAVDKVKANAERMRDAISGGLREGFDKGVAAGLRAFAERVRDAILTSAADQLAHRATERIFGKGSTQPPNPFNFNRLPGDRGYGGGTSGIGGPLGAIVDRWGYDDNPANRLPEKSRGGGLGSILRDALGLPSGEAAGTGRNVLEGVTFVGARFSGANFAATLTGPTSGGNRPTVEQTLFNVLQSSSA